MPGVSPALRPCMKIRASTISQPSSFRPGHASGGGARANGLMAAVVAVSRRARCARICLITAGSSILAITFTAPPQWSQVSISILNTRSTVALNAHRNVRGDLFSRLGTTPITPGRCHLLTPPVIRREHPVVARQVATAPRERRKTRSSKHPCTTCRASHVRLTCRGRYRSGHRDECITA